MGKYNWTDNQEKAIVTSGSDILVSAAAGSGKTAVLTERIIRKLIDPSGDFDVTDFLIVTFTVSATSELRAKLSTAINEAYLQNKNLKKLKKQLLMLPHAKIMTIDAFCKYIVNECARDLGIPVDMSLGDEGELQAIVSESIVEVTDELFEGYVHPLLYDVSYLPTEVKKGFVSLVEAFGASKGYDPLYEVLKDTYFKLLNFPEPFLKAKSLLSEYDRMLKEHYLEKGGASFFDSAIGMAVIGECRETVKTAISLLSEARDLCDNFPAMAEKYAPTVEEELSALMRIQNCNSPSHFLAALSDYKTTKLSAFSATTEAEEDAKKKFKAYRDTAKDIVEKEKKKFPSVDEEKLFLQTAGVFSIACELFAAVELIHKKVWETKLEKRILSFQDVSHLAFKALVKEGSYSHSTREFEKTDYAMTLSEKFREVLVDEYQDVNELQDAIFRAVSNSHNRFMVGDIKQSIYKFRGATPEIFMDYRNTFIPIDERWDGDSPRLIALQNNFRSDTSVIKLVNSLFEVIMNYEKEDVYRKDDHLVFSKEKDLGLTAEVSLFGDKGEFDYVADRIIDFTENGFPLSDIAVLARKHSSLVKLQEVLENKGIPSDYTPNKNFFESYEVATILSILRATDNPTDDISLLSALTSPVFSFLPSDLLKIRALSPDTDIYFSLSDYAERGSEKELREKCSFVKTKLGEWKVISRHLPTDSFIWQIYEETHFLSIVKALTDAKSREENLITFYGIAGGFEKRELRGLTKFLIFLESIIGQKTRYGKGKSTDNAVRLMTVHDSKGLEFPITFFVDAGAPISRQDERKKVTFSENFGPAFAIPVGKLGGKVTTYAEKAALSETRSGNADEELRLLYVALTRAKNKLIITGTESLNTFSTFLECSAVNKTSFSYLLKNASTLMRMISAGLMSDELFKKAIRSLSSEHRADFEVNVFSEYEASERVYEPSLKSVSVSDALTEEEIDFALMEFDKKRLANAPFKLSVSAVREGLLDESDLNKPSIKRYPDFMSLDGEKMASFRGTAMHTFMQFCDFKECKDKSTLEEAKRLLKYGFINSEQFEVLNHTALCKFFESRLFSEIYASSSVRREERYTLFFPSSEFFADEKTKRLLDESGKETLVQGVIDCYFENPDKTLTIVDFKTDNVGKETGERILKERHSKQLNLYRRAIEKIEGVKVKKVYIYSFCLGKEIEIDENDN